MPTDLTFDTVAIEGDSDGFGVLAYGPRHPVTFDPVDTSFGGLYVGRDGTKVYLGFRQAAASFGGSLGMFPVAALQFADVAIATGLTPPHLRGRYAMSFSSVDGIFGVTEPGAPVFGDNLPIRMAVSMRGNLKTFPPVPT